MRKIMAIVVMMLSLLPGTVLGAFLSLGQKVDFAAGCPLIEYETDSTIAVGVHDQRLHVINGEKSSNYVGTVRAGLGLPSKVITTSGKPLADDITLAIVSGFMHMGIKAQSTTTAITFLDSHQGALEKLKKLGQKRIILLTLREWLSDTYGNTGFRINAQLQVYNEEGKEIAIRSVNNLESFNGWVGVFSCPVCTGGSYLSRLLNDPNIKTALGSKPIAVIREISRDSRFIEYNNRTVLDTKTNLMWAAIDNWGNINWNDAKNYCNNYRGGGYTDWRLPTQNELSELYDTTKSHISDSGYDLYLTPLIRVTGIDVWASETQGLNAGIFSFNGGHRQWYPQNNVDAIRALPVRSAK